MEVIFALVVLKETSDKDYTLQHNSLF